MGNTGIAALTGVWNVKVYPECDSLIEPGKKSVLSAPVGKNLYLDFEEFFKDVALNAKTPITATHIPFVKEHLYSDKSENESESYYILNGKLLHSLGLQEGTEDVKEEFHTVTIDYEAKHITDECHNSETGEFHSMTQAYLILDKETETFRVEAWQDRPDGVRIADQQLATVIEFVFLKLHLLFRRFSTVRVRALQESPDGLPHQVVLSADMTEFYPTALELLDALVSQAKKECIETFKGSVEYGDDDTQVFLNHPFDFSRFPQAKALPYIRRKQHLTIDKDKKRLTFNWSIVNDETKEEFPVAQDIYQLYDDPVRVAHWSIMAANDAILATHYYAVLLAVKLNFLVREEEILKEFATLDENNVYF